MTNKIKTGLIGVGHLGNIHLKHLLEIPAIEVTGVYDTDPDALARAAENYGVTPYNDAASLIAASDAVDIVTPTVYHFGYARDAVKAGKHIFIEKPVTATSAEARELLDLVEEAGIVAQVGHVERYNPAFVQAYEKNLNPRFIEAHRLSKFNPRGTDVSVIMDLMIHDIDIALNLIDAPVNRISASAVPVISDQPDIANARIAFDNGSVANLTASRISLKKMRKMRLFEQNAYISIDFLKPKLEVFKLTEADENTDPGMLINTGNGSPDKAISFEHPETAPGNAILSELEDFAEAVLGRKPVSVSLDQATQALRVALIIQDKVENVKSS